MGKERHLYPSLGNQEKEKIYISKVVGVKMINF